VGNNKICTSKKNIYISLLGFIVLLFVLASTYILKTKPSYQSRAETLGRPTAYPTIPPTTDPKKILAYWLARELATNPQAKNNRDNSAESNAMYALFARNESEFVAEFDSEKNAVGNQVCFLMSKPYFNTPIQMIGAKAKDKAGNGNLRGLQPQGRYKLSFYKNTSSEYDLYISSWLADKPYSVKRVPHRAFVNAFAASLQSKKVPITSNTGFVGMNTGTCSGDYKIWVKWAESVVQDRGIDEIHGTQYDITSRLTPPPAPIPQPTVVKPVVEQKIAEFHRQFFQAFGYQFPELIIGPYVYKKFLGRTHAVYYLEDGHYQQMIDKMTELRSQYPEGILPYDDLESEEYIKKGFTPPIANIVDSKTFINYLSSGCSKPNWNPQFNCPVIPRGGMGALSISSYTYNKDRSFVIHFKPLQEITIPNYDINDMQMNLLIFLDE